MMPDFRKQDCQTAAQKFNRLSLSLSEQGGQREETIETAGEDVEVPSGLNARHSTSMAIRRMALFDLAMANRVYAKQQKGVSVSEKEEKGPEEKSVILVQGLVKTTEEVLLSAQEKTKAQREELLGS